MDWPSVQGVVENIVADIFIRLLVAAGAFVLARWVKREYSIRPSALVIVGIGIYALLMFAWNQTMPLSRPAYTLATPCQMRMSPDEREKILDFLRENASHRQKIEKIEILVEHERKDDCLYAQDLSHVFRSSHWGPAWIIVGKPPPFGKAVWFETSVNDGLARTFWEQTLCYLSQDFYHEEQTGVASNTWMLYVGDKEGPGGYSPEVICPNKRPGHENLSQPGR